MNVNKVEHERLIADYTEKFFTEVRIRSLRKGRGSFCMTTQSGGWQSISEEVLLKQGKFRKETFGLTDTVTPPMNTAEYLAFVQKVRDSSTVFEKE